MDVKIGITHSPREIIVSVDGDEAELHNTITSALAGSALTLIDNKGRKVIVPSDKIAYIEIGSADAPRVGFTTGQ